MQSSAAIAQQERQRAYYRDTADRYDDFHVSESGEHEMALAFLIAMLDQLGVRSILDIGSGTGRALLQLKAAAPHIRVLGIEPSADLREMGYRKGLRRDELVDGDAQALAYADGEFDLVSEFGALHHIPKPRAAVAEMLRVAHKAIFISDNNNYGQGSAPARAVKLSLRSAGLWKAFDLLRTRGKGYMESEGDGLFYSYSVFDDLPQIRRACARTHVMGTKDSGSNLIWSATHAAILGVKA